MRRRTWIAATVAAAALALTAGGYALAAGTFTDVTFAGCLSGGKLTQVQVTRTPSCAASATPVQWDGQAAVSPGPSPSPSPTTASPSPPPTTASPSPSLPATTPPPPASGFVTRSGATLMLNGSPYKTPGFNA